MPPVSHTQITYNYYNGTNADSGSAPAGSPPVPAAVAPLPAGPDALPPATAADAAGTPTAADPNQQQQQQQQQQMQNAPSPLGFIISDDDLQKLTEDLYSKDTNNAFKHITLKVQSQKTDDSTTDDASDK